VPRLDESLIQGIPGAGHVMRYCCLVVLMLKGVPRNISYHEMKEDLLSIPGVEAVHTLNIWSLTLDKVVVTVHLAIGAYAYCTR